VVRRLSAKGVSPRRLDLDHVCSKFGEEQHPDRPGNTPAEIEDSQPGQRAGRRDHPPVTKLSEKTTVTLFPSDGGGTIPHVLGRIRWSLIISPAGRKPTGIAASAHR